jgi:4-amino-4-deoxy-L-arabinose transferase-like glycosyltransferase
VIKINAPGRYVGWLLFLTASVYLLIIPLFMQGMFLDGTQYAVVAKNLAAGAGTFWEPYLGERWALHGKTAFLEHPPLGYYLQSKSFAVFGTSYLSERIFLFVFWGLSCGFIVALWREIKPTGTSTDWPPLLLWISIGTVGWSFQNNVLEVQVGLLCVISVWLILRGYQAQNVWSAFLYAVGAGLFVCAATLVKGLPALFPLVAPLALLFFQYKKRIWLLQIVVALTLLAGLAAVFYSSEMAQNALTFYVRERLFSRIATQPTVTSNLHIVGDLLMQLIPAVVLAVLPFFILRKTPNWNEHRQVFLFLLFIALSASLPLALTKVQRGFYLMPAYAYFALAFAFISADAWGDLLVILKTKAKNIAETVLYNLLLVGMVAAIFLAGTPKRDADMLHDVAELEQILPPKTILYYETGRQDQNFNWPFYMYLIRFSTLDAQIFTPNQQHLIQNKNLPAPNNYQKVKELNTIVLYRAKQ